MTTNPKIEELTRNMYEHARELLQQAKEAGLADGYHSISFGMKDDYIRVTVSHTDGTYEICTIGDETPRLSFREA